MNNILRDASGKEIGRISTIGNDIVLRDATGTEVGRYDTKADTTKDRRGKIVGRGNSLTMLLGLP